MNQSDPILIELSGFELAVGRVIRRVISQIGHAEEYRGRLLEAINRVLSDSVPCNRMAIFGGDRSRAFSWRGSAERVWHLHADL